MSRTPARFTQADVARALRAVERTGMRMVVEIDPNGTIRIVPYEAPRIAANDTKGSGRKLEQERRPLL